MYVCLLLLLADDVKDEMYCEMMLKMYRHVLSIYSLQTLCFIIAIYCKIDTIYSLLNQHPLMYMKEAFMNTCERENATAV